MKQKAWIGVLLITTVLRLEATELYALMKRSEIIPERGAVLRYALWNGEVDLSCIPPNRWDVSVISEGKKLSFRSIDLFSRVTVRVATKSPIQMSSLGQADALRNQIRQQYPEAIILEEATAYSAGGSGPMIELEIGTADSRTCHRIAWIPVNAGLIEFELTAPERHFAACYEAWRTILNSFRIDSGAPALH